MAVCWLFITSMAVTLPAYATTNDAKVTCSTGGYLGVPCTVTEGTAPGSTDTIHHIVVYRRDPGNVWVIEDHPVTPCNSNTFSFFLQFAERDYSLTVYDCENPDIGAFDSTRA